jgi:uncharacterized Ntn-hydrolase superfamily protein
VFTAEKKAWIAEREIKALPAGGLVGWARRASGMGAKPKVTPWEDGRVVRAFMAHEKERGREWEE